MKSFKTKQVQSMLDNRRLRIVLPIMVAVVVGGVGVYLLASTNAATPTATVELESGTVSSPATKISDASASGGAAIQFKETAPPPASTGQTLLSSNFDTARVSSPMLLADFYTAMGDTRSGGDYSLLNTSVRSESGRGNYMRQGLPANLVGGGSGIVVTPQLSKAVDEALISYDIRFAGDFDWSLGGKIPGLGGSSDGKPGVAAGCNDGLSTAWSGRGMWNRGGTWIGYLYNKYKTSSCGDSVSTGKAFTANKWHTIKQYYKMNTVTSGGVEANGVHKMWLDGVLVTSNSNLRYRDNANLRTNYLFWSIFRGGSDMTWSSPKAHYIDFDNLVVSSP